MTFKNTVGLVALLAVMSAACGSNPVGPGPEPTPTPAPSPTPVTRMILDSRPFSGGPGGVQYRNPAVSSAGMLDTVVRWGPVPPGSYVHVYLLRNTDDWRQCYWTPECPVALAQDYSRVEGVGEKRLSHRIAPGERLWVFARTWGPEPVAQGTVEIGFTAEP